jgi:hypothetical protein
MVSMHLFLIHLVFGHIFERGSFQYRLLSNVNSLLSMFIIVYAILATNSYKSFLCMCKGWSDAVDQRRTNKTMTKRKRRKGQTTVYKNTTKKTKDWATWTPLMLLQEGKQCVCPFLLFLLVIVLFVLLWSTASDQPLHKQRNEL